MKFGIIGAGAIARIHAQAIGAMRNGELAAVTARHLEHARQITDEFGGRAYDDVADMLADPAVQVVTIATPSGAHLGPTLAAAEAGKHVLVEKPLEVTVDRIDRMIAACEKAGVMLGAILNRRFNPAVDALKRAVDEGRFGRLTLCSAYVKWWRTQAYYDAKAWRGTWALDGGGALMNQSIHTIDQLLYFAGDVRRVSAFTARVAHEGIEVEDVGVAVLEFANGARGVIEGTTAAWSPTGHQAEVQLCGTSGSVFLADQALRLWQFRDDRPEDAQARTELMADPTQAGLGAADPAAITAIMHRRNFEHFVDAVEGRCELKVSGQEARRAVELITTIYASAKRGGEPVTVGEV